MQIKIPIRALSVNDASRGRHFKSPEYKKFERDVTLLLPFSKTSPIEGEVFIKYIFYFKNYANSDASNGIKLIEDLLVKRGYLKDDRYVKGGFFIKEPVSDVKDEKIIMDIVPIKDMMSVIDVL